MTRAKRTFVRMQRKENSVLVASTKARYEAVHALKADGKGIKTIMRDLGGWPRKPSVASTGPTASRTAGHASDGPA